MSTKGNAHAQPHRTSPAKHKAARSVIRVINSVITFLEVVVLLGMLIFGVYAIWDNKQIDNENTASEYEMYKPTAKDTRTYEDFRAVNPDVCGWLTITGTGVDYPLVQGEDNDEYMNKTPDLKFALSGSLFLDYRNAEDFSDYNTIIYGHHMEGPSMFGALDQYASEEFFEDHEEGLLYFDSRWHVLEIFAYLEVDAYDQEIYGIAGSEEAFQTYLDDVRAKAVHYRDVGVDAEDHILVMSTCMTDKTNGRYIVLAKIGAVTDGPQEQETGRVYSRDGLSPQQWNLIFAGIGAGVILLLILLYLWYRHRKRVKERKKAAVSAAVQFADNDWYISSAAEVQGEFGEATEESGGMAKAMGKRGRKKKTRSVWGDLLDLLLRLAIIAAVVWVIFHFVFGLFVNSGVAMEPSVQDRDIILFYRLDNEYTANEAVVYEAEGEERLGRIVARGGDTVEITEEGLKVNGYLQQDYKNVGETLAAQDGTEYPITLAEDEFFILGDNREESEDSRMFGPVSLDDVKGSVLTVLRRRDV